MEDDQTFKENIQKKLKDQENRDLGYMSCPMCDAEIPISADEKKEGEELSCSFCSISLKVRKSTEDDIYLEEDF